MADVEPVAEARLRVLDRAELPVDTVRLARFLIGKMVQRELAAGVVSGRIVETEAYDIGDPAGHAYRGVTPRTRSLFLERGHAYVYLAYGSSFMLNVSSEMPGVGAGVLIRAIEPTSGIGTMRKNRGTEKVRDLARGPGRLCAALGVDRRLDGIDLCRDGPDASQTTLRHPAKSGGADGSASHARQTASCDSTSAGMASSAARGPSTDERFGRRSSQ
jgi:DNA-3-methyladenine glycosylase